MTRLRFRATRSSGRILCAIEALEARRQLDAESLIGLDAFRQDSRFAGIDGSGYSVVVIDHGADVDHTFFGPDLDGNGVADRIIAQYDFGDNDPSAAEDSSVGHGTSVAAIIGSQDVNFPGVAPGANLIILKLFPSAFDAPSPSLADLEEPLQWVEQRITQYNIVAVNLSITDSENYTQPEAAKITSDEFARLANRGVIVVGAAGNEYATLEGAAGVGYPAADPNVIAVSGVWADNYGLQDFGGAVSTKTGPNQIAAFSQRDPALTDVFAPAGLITTATSGGGIVTRRGTSFAAPYVTGAAVLAQQLAERELGRRLTLEEFRDRLRSTGLLIHDGDDEDDNVPNTDADYRRLDLLALGDSILVNPGPPQLSVSGVTVSEGSSGTTNVEVVVTISRQPQAIVTVRYATADGSATAADNDYTPVSGLLVFFPGGPLVRTISIPVAADTRFEATEMFQITLSGATNAGIANEAATVTIQDDDQSRPWQNPLNALDVNRSGTVTGLDALIVINRLNVTGPEVLPTATPVGPFFFYDVTGDGRVTALDALRVINHLNAVAAGQTGSVAAAGEGQDDGTVPPPTSKPEAAVEIDAAIEPEALGNVPLSAHALALFGRGTTGERAAFRAVYRVPGAIEQDRTDIAEKTDRAWNFFWAGYEAAQQDRHPAAYRRQRTATFGNQPR